MAAQWFKCTVTRAGPAEDGNVYIGLKDIDGTFNSQWFTANQAVRREMLETALAAMASDFRVSAQIEGTHEYSILNRLYITKG